MEELVEKLRMISTHNEPWEWVVACVTTMFVCLAAVAVRRWVRGRYQRLVQTERVELLEVPFEIASKTSSVFLCLISLYCGLRMLELSPPVERLTTTVLTVVGFWQLGLWGSAAVLSWLMMRRKKALEHDRAAVGSLGIIGFVMRGLVWTLVLLLTLDNLGIDITALVAGLGVGGIAVALAVQNVLSDVFASLSITLDRPFVVGDFVVVGECMGSVEQIGVKSTRLRSLGGEQIILANADLLASRVRNYGRMQERRVVFTIGVTYETPRELLAQIPRMIRECVERNDTTRFDRCHFTKFGAFSLDFETVYFVLSADFNMHMDIQQEIYFAIHEAFERAPIQFAYPTQTLWIAARDGADARPSLLRGLDGAAKSSGAA